MTVGADPTSASGASSESVTSGRLEHLCHCREVCLDSLGLFGYIENRVILGS